MLKSILKFFTADILAKAAAVALLPLYSIIMGPSQLGKFSEWFSIYNVFVALVSVGIPSYVLVLLNSDSNASIKKLTAQFLTFTVKWVLILSIPLLAYGLITQHFFYILGLLIAAICFGLMNYLESILRFKSSIKHYFALELSLTFATSVLPLLFVLINSSWDYRAWGQIIGLFLLVIVLKLFFIPTVPLVKIDKTFKKELLKFGLPIVLIVGVTWLKLGIDIQLLKGLDNYKSSGILFFSFQIIAIINILAASLNRSAATVFYELIGKAKLSQFYTLVFKLLGLLILFAILIVYGSIMGIKLYLPQFAAATNLMYLMAAGVIVYALGQFLSALFLFYKKTYFLTASILIGSLTHPLSSYYIIHSFGAQNIGYSYLFSSIIFLFFVLLFSSFIKKPVSREEDLISSINLVKEKI